jgi:hypothetical protein
VELRYLGFDQNQNTRTYKFDRLSKGEPPAHFAVIADMTLFLKHRVAIQEGPSLCARKLSSDLESLAEGEHHLTNDDLQAYVSARADADARKAAQRKAVPHRRH